MGLFNSLFGNTTTNKEEPTNINWLQLTDISQLDTIKSNSKDKTQLIFKHSTSCGISNMVIKMFESTYALEKDTIDLYYLDLLSNRPVSNGVAEKFGVMHQSPQLLIIKNGEVVFHESHGAITDTDLEKYI